MKENQYFVYIMSNQDHTVLYTGVTYEHMHPQRSQKIISAQRKGREFLLNHRLYKSIQTGEALDNKITLFSFLPRWHYDVLVVLEYFQDCRVERDERLKEAINLLERKRNPEGSWDLQNKHAGKIFFEMEQAGKPSRWNTLRALRVLKWWMMSTAGHAAKSS